MSKSKGYKVSLASLADKDLRKKQSPQAGDTVPRENPCLECTVLGSNSSTNKKGKRKITLGKVLQKNYGL